MYNEKEKVLEEKLRYLEQLEQDVEAMLIALSREDFKNRGVKCGRGHNEWASDVIVDHTPHGKEFMYICDVCKHEWEASHEAN